MTLAKPLSPEARQGLLEAYRAAPVFAGTPAGPLIAALRAEWPQSIAALATDEIVAELLVGAPIYPLGLEAALSAVRRTLLLAAPDVPGVGALAARMALQAGLNEHAWAARPDEDRSLDELAGRVGDLNPIEAMLLASYRPLSKTPGAEALLRKRWGGLFHSVLWDHLVLPASDAQRADGIERLTLVRGGVSAAVRDQYEANPYPRWARTPHAPRANAIFGVSPPAAPDILIAGCGTGYQAIIAAQRFPEGRVTAVDLSRSSLAYARRKAEEAGIGNLSFFQADLLELPVTGREYDIIECTGVLHHMADPFEGARAVSRLLKPGGLMKIALYSALARAKLRPAKALARTFPLNRIAHMRRAIAEAGPAERVVGRFLDFYATSPCRDLLMHVQEHEMSLDEVARLLAENGLSLLAMLTSETVRNQYLAMFPGDREARDLGRLATFEAAFPDTFEDMYQFWAVKAP